MTEKVVRLVIGQAVVTVLLARYLGPEEFGLLHWALAVVALCGVLAGLGLDELVIRELVRRPEAEQPQVLASAKTLKALGSGGAVVLAVSIAIGLRSQAPHAWAVVGLLALGLLFSPWDVIDGWFQSRGRFGPPVAARLAGFFAGAAMKIVLIVLGAPLWALALATAAEAAAAAKGLSWAAGRAGVPRCWRAARPAEMRALLGECWPLIVSGFLVLATMQLDKVLVAQMAGDQVAGHYAAAARLTELFYAVPVALGAAVAPGLARRHEVDRDGFWQGARRLALLFGIGGASIAGLISWRANDVVGLFFGPAYASSAPPLAAHVWSLGFIFLVSLRSRLLVLEGRSSWVAVLAGTTLIMNLGLNVWLIPRFGAIGAAWAATGAWGFSALLAPALFPRMHPMIREFLGGASKQA